MYFMKINLKPCPFCGGVAEVFIGDIVSGVNCSECKAEMWTSDAAEEAIEAWNRRIE